MIGGGPPILRPGQGRGRGRHNWSGGGSGGEGAPLDPGVVVASPGDGTVALSFTTPPSGGSESYTYQWQRSTTSGSGFSNLSGATSATHDDTTVSNGTTYYYQCVVDDGADNETTNETSATPAVSSAFFEDSFASGDFSKTGGGFSWGGRTDCAMQTDNPRTGTHCPRFDYTNNRGGGVDAWAELRFNFGTNKQEIWWEYYIYFPDGTEGLGSGAYDHQNVSGPDNNKFFKLMEQDSGSTITFLMESFPKSSPNITGTRAMWGNPEDGVSSNGHGMTDVNDLVTESDLGNWVQFRFHQKISDEGGANGRYEFWKNGVQKIDETFNNEPSDYANAVMKKGYLMGWWNAGVVNDPTYIWIDDVKFYDTDPGW